MSFNYLNLKNVIARTDNNVFVYSISHLYSQTYVIHRELISYCIIDILMIHISNNCIFRYYKVVKFFSADKLYEEEIKLLNAFNY